MNDAEIQTIIHLSLSQSAIKQDKKNMPGPHDSRFDAMAAEEDSDSFADSTDAAGDLSGVVLRQQSHVKFHDSPISDGNVQMQNIRKQLKDKFLIERRLAHQKWGIIPRANLNESQPAPLATDVSMIMPRHNSKENNGAIGGSFSTRPVAKDPIAQPNNDNAGRQTNAGKTRIVTQTELEELESEVDRSLNELNASIAKPASGSAQNSKEKKDDAIVAGSFSNRPSNNAAVSAVQNENNKDQSDTDDKRRREFDSIVAQIRKSIEGMKVSESKIQEHLESIKKQSESDAVRIEGAEKAAATQFQKDALDTFRRAAAIRKHCLTEATLFHQKTLETINQTEVIMSETESLVGKVRDTETQKPSQASIADVLRLRGLVMEYESSVSTMGSKVMNLLIQCTNANSTVEQQKRQENIGSAGNDTDKNNDSDSEVELDND